MVERGPARLVSEGTAMPGQLAAAASQRLANELVDLGAPKPPRAGLGPTKTDDERTSRPATWRRCCGSNKPYSPLLERMAPSADTLGRGPQRPNPSNGAGSYRVTADALSKLATDNLWARFCIAVRQPVAARRSSVSPSGLAGVGLGGFCRGRAMAQLRSIRSVSAA